MAGLVYDPAGPRAGRVQHDSEDRSLVRAVLAGEPDARARFVRRAADTVWACCRRLTGDDASARAGFEAAMAAIQADNFACLWAFSGRSRLDTFLALVVRDLLGRDVLRRVAENSAKGWPAFEALFGSELRRLVQRRLPGPVWAETRQDAYQEICAGLLAANSRRLNAYQGHGSPAGFVLHLADRLLVDFIRSFRARRRLPSTIARLEPLDQELFQLIWWRGMTVEAAGMVLEQQREGVGRAELSAALARVHRAVPADYHPEVRQMALAEAPEIPSAALSPEAAILAGEESVALANATQAIRELAPGLAAAERLYLRLLLTGADDLSPRKIARLMQQPVEEVYRLRQRVLKKLKDQLADHPAIKNWLASV
jgi:RNA polymerase primary sigma factor